MNTLSSSDTGKQMVSTLKEINVISNTQVTGLQTISIDELAKQLTTTDSVKQFHINLPDDLKRNLSPFVSGPKNEYINKLNSELTKGHYSLATNASSHTPGAGYVNAYYPNFREEEPKVAPQIPVNEEPQDNRQELEYSFELAGGKSAFAKHVGWTFALSATEEEPANKSWQESESELGSILTAKTKVSVPRRLCSESGSSPMPLTAENTNSTNVGSNKADEAFMAIMPTIQFGDKLGCPTQGYYYHFKDGKLIQEYKILGDKKFAFNLTYSDESSLTDDLRLNKPQSAIPILWRDQGSDVPCQHLLYQTNKLTSEKLSEVDTSWLDEHGLALDMGELSKICAGEDSDNDQYHSPTNCTYEHPGLFLHGTEIVALNNPSNMSKGVPVVNLKPEKIFRIGVFFDGTGQNDKNDAYKEERGNKSRTNVARLFAAYPQNPGESAAIYVSGVGTVDIDDDAQRAAIIDEGDDETGIEQAIGVDARKYPELVSSITSAFGMVGHLALDYASGENGAFYKWQTLLNQLKETIAILIQDEMYDSITHIAFDVIGFSRGAALARHFTNAVYHGLPDYTKPLSKDEANIDTVPHLRGDESKDQFDDSIAYPHDTSKNVSVRFLGLFDTVGSFYLAGNDDEGNFELGLEPSCAQTVFQISAEHEYRKNFPLTSLKRDNWLPDNFYEEVFPGCHTDIGGGYPSIKQYDKKDLPEELGFPVLSTYNRELIKTEKLVVDYSNFTYPGGSADRKAAMEKQNRDKSATWNIECQQKLGYFGESQLVNETVHYYLLQPISNAIAGLALERMKQQAQQAGIEWQETDYLDNLTPDYVSDSVCKTLWQSLSSKPLGTITPKSWQEQSEKLLKLYIHRPHDTVINPGYNSLFEKLVNGFTTDSSGLPERRIWENV